VEYGTLAGPGRPAVLQFVPPFAVAAMARRRAYGGKDSHLWEILPHVRNIPTFFASMQVT